MVDISSISANIDFLNSWLNNIFVADSGSNLFQNFVVLLVLWMTDDTYTWIPLWLFGAEDVSINSVLNFFDDLVNFAVNMLMRCAFVVLLVLGVVQLTVSD